MPGCCETAASEPSKAAMNKNFLIRYELYVFTISRIYFPGYVAGNLNESATL